MATYPREAWQRLGDLLVTRRVELDARYRNRREFAREVQMDYRVIYDIEVARRSNFGTSTLRGLELAYQLPTGALDDFLGGRAEDLFGASRDRVEPIPEPHVHDAAGSHPDTATAAAIQVALEMVGRWTAAKDKERELKDQEIAEKIAEQNRLLEQQARLVEGQSAEITRLRRVMEGHDGEPDEESGEDSREAI